MVRIESHRPDTHRCPKHLMGLAVLAALTYILNRWGLMLTENPTPFLSSYLGDFLALPVYLPLSVGLAQRLKLIDLNFQLGSVQIILAVMVFSVLFEGVVPLLNSDSVADPWDILAYLGGGLLVLGVQAFCVKKKQ